MSSTWVGVLNGHALSSGIPGESCPPLKADAINELADYLRSDFDFTPYRQRSGWLNELDRLVTTLRRLTESDVILVAGLTDIKSDWHRGVAYVGMSRARTRLHVFVREDCDKKRRARAEEWRERVTDPVGAYARQE